MNAKQWLGRARFIDRELKALKREKQKTLDDLTKITQSYETKANILDFPAGPVVKTLHSQCRDPGLDPWSGN